jgi:hypothetical protein
MIVKAVLRRTLDTKAVSPVGIPLANCGLPAGDIRHATVQPREERAS